MRAGKAIAAVALTMLAPVARAQQVTEVTAGNAPEDSGGQPIDESGKAADRGGLAGRGGAALESRRTFQETIGTEIYTPIRNSIFTPVQRPPNSTEPQG